MWLKGLLVAALSGLAGMAGAGFVANLAVEWYNISSFEGGAGFFVVGMALVGLIGGGVIGLITSVVMARRGRAGVGPSLAASAGVVASIIAIVAGASWALADIPPLIDGEELFLLAEIRWPVSGAPAPSEMPEEPHLYLGALSAETMRKSEAGPAFMQDARQDEGRWIVTGAVPIFTSRGRRVLGLTTRDQSLAAFIVPLPAHPGEQHRQWSEWLPHTATEQPEPPNRFSYRYKVIKRSEPVRTQKVGRFEVDTIADYFYNVTGIDQMAALSRFDVRYDGQPIPGIATARTVDVISPGNALLVTIDDPEHHTPCALLIAEGNAVRVDRVKGCGTPLTVRLLTADTKRFAAHKGRQSLPGWIDRTAFPEPGLFQLDAAIVDTRDLTSATFLFPDDLRPNTAVPPLSLSPDEQSFVWLPVRFDERPQLGVTNWRRNQTYTLPVDRARMRLSTESSLTPDWVQHHFEWQRGPDGVDVLVEREDFVPLPYRGDLTLGRPGEYQGYTLRPGSERLRDTMVEILSRDLAGEMLPDEVAGFRRVRVKGKVLTVSVVGSPEYVDISMDTDGSDPQVMSAIAAALDAALATGRYDALFAGR